MTPQERAYYTWENCKDNEGSMLAILTFLIDRIERLETEKGTEQ